MMKIGDKVVYVEVIDNTDQYGNILPKTPIKDKIYTVEHICEREEGVFLRLREFPGPWLYKIEAFRKVEPGLTLQRELALMAVKESQKIEIIEPELIPT